MTNNYETLPNGYKMRQGKDYHFTSDSVLLANFFRFKRRDRAVELCAGSGIIGIYAYSQHPCEHIDVVEINPNDCKVIADNITLNNLPASVMNVDAKTLTTTSFARPVDVVICNPPYEKVTNLASENKNIARATHEIDINFDDIASVSALILKSGGHLYIEHKAERVAEIIVTLKKYRFATKRMCFVYAKNKPAYLVMIDAVLDGHDNVQVSFKENI